MPEKSLLDLMKKTFGPDRAVVMAVIHGAGELPKLKDGQFKSGWESALEEVCARCDEVHGDGSHVMQDFAQHMINVINGDAVVVYPDGESYRFMTTQ